MWGKGIYFAQNASYSCGAGRYSYPVSQSYNTFEVFFANVIIGNAIELISTTNLMEPPTVNKICYDSVKGNTQGSDVYIVYKNVKTYPGLIVKYSV